MANLIATNLGEINALSEFFDFGTVANSSLQTTPYSTALGWPNGNGRTLRTSSFGDNSENAFTIVALVEGYLHFRVSAPGTATSPRICTFREGATSHLELYWNGDGTFQFKRNGTNIGSASASYARTGARDIQIHFKIDSTTGIAELRVDGSTANDITFSGNVRNGGTGNVTNIGLSTPGTSVVHDFSDIVLNDTTGGNENSWTGAVRVVLGVPSAAGASGTQWTPNASTNVSRIADAIPGTHDGDTTYNEESVANNKDWFTWPSSVFTGMSPASIKFVRTKYWARAADGGSHTMRSNAKNGGTTVNGTTISLNASFVKREDVYYTDPNTSAAWASFAAITGAEFGYELIS